MIREFFQRFALVVRWLIRQYRRNRNSSFRTIRTCFLCSGFGRNWPMARPSSGSCRTALGDEDDLAPPVAGHARRQGFKPARAGRTEEHAPELPVPSMRSCFPLQPSAGMAQRADAAHQLQTETIDLLDMISFINFFSSQCNVAVYSGECISSSRRAVVISKESAPYNQAMAGDRLFSRTLTKLYCFRKTGEAVAVTAAETAPFAARIGPRLMKASSSGARICDDL